MLSMAGPFAPLSHRGGRRLTICRRLPYLQTSLDPADTRRWNLC